MPKVLKKYTKKNKMIKENFESPNHSVACRNLQWQLRCQRSHFKYSGSIV